MASPGHPGPSGASGFRGPYLHQATQRYYWWSEPQQCFVFDDGTKVPVPPTSNTQRAAVSSSSSTPRTIPPPAPAVQWTTWKQGQSFGRGSTIRIRAGPDEPPVTRKELLGSGMHATVYRVRIDVTREVCALKNYKPIYPGQMILEKFENEIHNMRRVSNRHIARFFAAYIYERKNQSPEFGILMQPVADGGTLENFLEICRSRPTKVTKQHRQVLLKAFGCLASALGFLHQHMMRHKDVKSSNVLLHEGRVLLADFGSSWDGTDNQSLVTTSDNPKGHTPRYAAPEVNSRDPRNAKSDIFSLGGVFYEILCGLEPAKWYDEDFCRIVKDLRNSLGQWKASQPEVVPLIYRMLDPTPTGRPSASQLVESLSATHFCDRCCEVLGKESASSASEQQVGQLMARLDIKDSQGGTSGSTQAAARRDSGSLRSVSHGSNRAYAFGRGKSKVEEQNDESSDDVDENDSDDDTDSDD